MARIALRLPKKKLTIKLPKRTKFRSFRGVVSILILLGLVLFGTSGYFWYKNMLTDPKHVFEGMLEKSLQTDSVTRSVHQVSSLRTTDQTYYTAYVPASRVESTTVIEQVGQDRQKTSVTTKSIGTKDTDYIQYSDVQIPSLKQDGVKEILNQWAKHAVDTKSGEQPQYLNEALFTFVPFGNLSSSDRLTLLDKIKSTGAYSYKLKDGVDYGNGRPTMTFYVTIKPQALVEVLREYVTLTGVGDASQLNPADYEGSSNVDVEMTIDVLSRHLEDISFAGDQRSEHYSSYGMNRHIELPSQTISTDELQNRLQKLQ